MKLSVIALLGLLALAPAASAQTPPQTAAQDQAISERIGAKFATDPALKADAVKISVDTGVVTLSGVVATDADKARAERLANVEGVIRINNKITTRSDVKEKTKGTAGTV